MSDLIKNFINYGVPSDLAQDLITKGLSISTFKNTSKINLLTKYNLDQNIIDFVTNCIKRKPIEDSILQSLLERSNYTCNVCKGTKGKSYIIHHIIEYSKSQDNSYDNLIVLCPNCHDMAHTKGGLTNSISINELRQLKYKWEKEVENYNASKAGKEGHVQDVDYVNIPRITELVYKLRNQLPVTQ